MTNVTTKLCAAMYEIDDKLVPIPVTLVKRIVTRNAHVCDHVDPVQFALGDHVDVHCEQLRRGRQ